MSRQLPADCLYEIFEYFKNDKVTLFSCLLVNRLWFDVSARILWRNVWNFTSSQSHHSHALLSTLISCLPDESRDLLHKNKIFILTSTTSKPLFNYACYLRALSINDFDNMIRQVLVNQQTLLIHKYLVTQEILKMFMKQIPSLEKLKYNSTEKLYSVYFTYFPETVNC